MIYIAIHTLNFEACMVHATITIACVKLCKYVTCMHAWMVFPVTVTKFTKYIDICKFLYLGNFTLIVTIL